MSTPIGPPGDPPPRLHATGTPPLAVEDFRSMRRWLIVLGLISVLAAGVAVFAVIKANESNSEAADKDRLVLLERSLDRRLAEVDNRLNRTGSEIDSQEGRLRRTGEESDVASGGVPVACSRGGGSPGGPIGVDIVSGTLRARAADGQPAGADARRGVGQTLAPTPRLRDDVRSDQLSDGSSSAGRSPCGRIRPPPRAPSLGQFLPAPLPGPEAESPRRTVSQEPFGLSAVASAITSSSRFATSSPAPQVTVSTAPSRASMTSSPSHGTTIEVTLPIETQPTGDVDAA